MTTAHQTGFGVAKKNQMNEICRIGEAAGPLTILITNEGESNIVITAIKKSDSSRVAFADETNVSGENSGYAGDGGTRNFSGQSLNNVPIVPGSVRVVVTAGGTGLDSVDTNGDGDLYTVESTPEFCGTINYMTGALILRYPASHVPAAGAITANYAYSSAALKPHAKISKRLNNLPPSETYIIKAASTASTGAAKIKVDAFITF